MTALLGEIGQRLADRWAAVLVIPGLLYVAAVTMARVLGQHRALSFSVLSGQATRWANSPALHSAGGVGLLLAAVLAGSALAALTAAAGGKLTEMIWTLPGRRPPAGWLAASRRRRSLAAKQAADDAASPALARAAMSRADRISVVQADHPTWIGDRLHACHVRIEQAYGLDLVVIWPRLWLFVPDTARTELGLARDAFSCAARLTAWAALYLVLGIWWWPALVVGAVAAVAGNVRGRFAIGNLADLVESTIDLYHHDFITQLAGTTPADPATVAMGRKLTTAMRKSRWEPGSPTAD
jgi:hypothetical protein